MQLEFLFEEWRVVEGYEGFYEVSNTGLVRSVARISTGRWGVNHYSGKIRVPLINAYGYLTLNLSREGKSHTEKVHCLVATAFIGPKPPGKQVHHKDFNKLNNAVWNLEYVTNAENLEADWKAGRRKGMQGEKHPLQRLKKEDVLEMRRLYTEGVSVGALAKIYKVGHAQSSRIVNRKRWSHI